MLKMEQLLKQSVELLENFSQACTTWRAKFNLPATDKTNQKTFVLKHFVIKHV